MADQNIIKVKRKKERKKSNDGGMLLEAGTSVPHKDVFEELLLTRENFQDKLTKKIK